MDLKTRVSRDRLLDEPNIATVIRSESLKIIGQLVCEEYAKDYQSCTQRFTLLKDSVKLALQVREEKTFPWAGAANVKFPLLSIAALQFSSRVYPAFVSGPTVVKCRIMGKDPEGKKAARAARIEQHMSYQVLEEDEAWEEQHDAMLTALPIVGCTFKKSYYCPLREHNVSEFVLPLNLVLPYTAKFEKSPRMTHRIFLSPREMKERQNKEVFLKVDLEEATYVSEDPGQDEREGVEPRSEKLHEVLEQHRFLDLDGDGYEEPYIVTVNKADQKVLRIYPRYRDEDIETDQEARIKSITRLAMMDAQKNPEQGAMILKDAEAQVREIRRTAKVLRIRPCTYFTKYGMVPSPDGGVYDIGFGDLLGPINESVSTIVNQLLDSGTLANASGGFLGKGAKIRGGKIKVNPFEWTPVDVPGGDLKANMVPYPVREPSGVLFNLLSMLINYGERLTSVTDLMSGETPGQNTPATTSMAALEQGMKVFQGIFKRLFRSTTHEFRKLYKLNRQYLDFEKYVSLMDEDAELLQTDYYGDPKDIIPVADVSMLADSQMISQAQFLAQRAMAVPGYNLAETERFLLRAMRIPDVDKLFPLDDKGNPVIQPPPNPEIMLKTAEEERRVKESEYRNENNKRQTEISAIQAMSSIEKDKAAIALDMAQAEKLGVDTDLAPFKLALEGQEARMKHIEALAKIEKANESSRRKGVAE
jgi:hypothetical protein